MTKQYLRLISAIALGLTLTALSCSSTTDCDSFGACKPMAGSGGSAGSHAGNSEGGNAGSDNGGHAGIASGGSGNGGASAGSAGINSQAGEAGAAGAQPCGGKCSAPTPACDPTSNTCVECTDKSTCTSPKAACNPTTNKCVECTDKSTCSGAKPACDTTKNACVECTTKTDCTNGAKPLCDTTAETCVACLQQSDCTGPTASACNAGACTACTKDAECSNIAGKGVCNAGTCVQCTGSKFAACGSSMGTPLVCDSLQHTCTSNKQASGDLCQPCVSDAQCMPGKMCVQEQFGSPTQNVGYFCFWKKGDTADGAPTTCLPGADPYSATLTNATSIDGAKADICSLAASTCIANNEFRTKDCKNVAVPDDSLCGFAPTKDSKCAQADVGVFRCTMTCLSSDDCPGTTCLPGASPRLCGLQ